MFTTLGAVKLVISGLLIIGGNALFEKMTGMEILEYATEVLPQITSLVTSSFDLFGKFFDILPSHVAAIFWCFSSLMVVIVIYRLSKGGS